MKKFEILSLLFLVFSFWGCSSLEHATRDSEKQMHKVMQIKTGMTKQEVMRIMEMAPINRQLSTAEDGATHEALQWDLGNSPRATPDFSERSMLIVYFRNRRVTDIETFPDAHGNFMEIRWENRPEFML